MLKKVSIEQRIRVRDFLKFISAEDAEILHHQAESLKGKKVAHINATEIGGGVAEILRSLIPYLRALGVESDWYVIDPKVGNGFFSFTNKLHNAFQGIPVKLSAEEWAMYENASQDIAESLKRIDCDILAINDPQPLLAGSLLDNGRLRVYFSHIDTSNAYMPVWERVLKAIKNYDRIVFSNKDFIHTSLSAADVEVFTPAIDPLAAKQMIVPQIEARRYLKEYGIREEGPLIVQVSRFDIWKNPRGVIEAFRIMKNNHPDAQLVMTGFNEAKDNPGAEAVYKDIATICDKSPDIFLFFDPAGKNVTEFTVMAQNAADIIVQNSVKEGFGLTVTEAMWKRKPVIGGPASGIRAQITNDSDGFIIETPEELAEKADFLLKHPEWREKMGERAHQTVIKKFLFPRLVADHLKVYNKAIDSH